MNTVEKKVKPKRKPVQEEVVEEQFDCGDCHGDSGDPPANDGTDLCISCRKNADIPEEED